MNITRIFEIENHRKYMKEMFAKMTIENVDVSFIEALYATESYLVHEELLTN